MQLTGEQYQELQRALTHAFPTHEDLAQVVRFKLDQNLNVITPSGDLNAVAYKLIEWLVAHNKVCMFITGARTVNPDNNELRLFDERYCGDAGGAAKQLSNSNNGGFEEAFKIETQHARRQIKKTIPGLENPLPRSEIEWLEEQLQNSVPVLFTGNAGTGKSGIADILAETAFKAEKGILFIDARRTAFIQNVTQLRDHLGLSVPLVSAIEDVAERRRCRVIIEQLDSSIGFEAARVLVDLAVVCCRIKGVEIIVVSRKREANEEALLQPLTSEGFQEHTSYPLGPNDAERVLEQLGISSPSVDLVKLGCNLLNLELIGKVKQEKPDYDFSQAMSDVDLWEQYLETIVERDLMLRNPQAARQVIAEAMQLAKLGLNSEDRTFTLDYDMPLQQSRLISWDMILCEVGRKYRFRHEKLQDYLYARDAAERALMPKDVAGEINPFRTANVIRWMDKIYRRPGYEAIRGRFMREGLNG